MRFRISIEFLSGFLASVLMETFSHFFLKIITLNNLLRQNYKNSGDSRQTRRISYSMKKTEKSCFS